MKTNSTIPVWTTRSRLSLLFAVIGTPKQISKKIKEMIHILSGYFGNPIVQERLHRLKSLGHISETPTVSQLLIAGRDQILLTASDETRIFYENQGIPWVFHNIRRFLACPGSMMDPVGLLCSADTIIHHIFQTIHRHPIYDFVLLRAHRGGVEDLQEAFDQLMKGVHPEQKALETMPESSIYWDQLRIQIPEFVRNPYQKALTLEQNLTDDPVLMLGMDQFKDIKGYTDYAFKLRVGRMSVFVAVIQVFWNSLLGKRMGWIWGPKSLNVNCCSPELRKKYGL